jgi:hypothetical protein
VVILSKQYIKKDYNLPMKLKTLLLTPSILLSTFVLIIMNQSFAAYLSYSPEGKPGFHSFERKMDATGSYGYKIVEAPHPVRAGKFSERFEVRHGDCGISVTFSDCATDRERLELASKVIYDSVGDEVWYGWSFFVPKEIKSILPAWTTLGQLFSVNNATALIETFWREGPNTIDDICCKEPQFEFVVKPGTEERQAVTLFLDEEMKGKWQDILLYVKWSDKEDGLVKVWVNGDLKASIEGPQAHFSSDDRIRFNYGIYRQRLSWYKYDDKDIVPTQVVYFDEIRRGKERKDVDIRMLEASEE